MRKGLSSFTTLTRALAPPPALRRLRCHPQQRLSHNVSALSFADHLLISSTGLLAPRQLNEAIHRSHSLHGLLRLFSQHVDDYDKHHLVTTWKQVGRLANATSSQAARTKQESELAALRKQTEAMLPALDDRGLTIVGHGLARSRLKGTEWNVLWAELATEVSGRLGDLEAQSLSMLVWSFATGGYTSPRLFGRLAAEAERRVGQLSPQSVANIAWAFATMGHAAPELFDALAVDAERLLEDFKPQEMANLAWAFAKAGHLAPKLFDALAAEAQRRLLADYKPQELANTAWAFATLGHPAPRLFEALSAEMERRVDDFNPQELANTTWAFAVLDVPCAAVCGATMVRRLDGVAPAGWSVQNLTQLHQWDLWRQEHTLAEPPLSPALRMRCHMSLVEVETRPSGLQREVATALLALDKTSRVREEVLTPEGYTVDVEVEYGGARVGIEVDGPSHFYGRAPTGATLLKRRQLRATGWRLLSVPHWEWRALKTSTRKRADLRLQQQKYLLELLEGSPTPTLRAVARSWLARIRVYANRVAAGTLDVRVAAGTLDGRKDGKR